MNSHSLKAGKNNHLVADTGPLLALARIQFLPILSQLFTPCWLTETIFAECTAKPESGDAIAVSRALQHHHLQLAADPVPRRAFASLDMGESTALELAVRQGATILLDERRGREAAKSYGLTLIGTAGVVLLAKRQGLVSEVMPTIQHLEKSGYYLGELLMKQIRELANE